MSNALLLIILAAASYGVGNINWAIVVSVVRKKDIRKLGSGNPGTLNVGRNFGLATGILVFILEVLKGVVPTLAAFFLLREKGTFDGSAYKVMDLGIYLCGLMVVLGHIYPVAFAFKGGKGIATTIGVFIVCNSVHGWQWSLVSVMAIIFILATEFGAMGSFIAITPPVVACSIYLFLAYAGADRITLLYCIITNMTIFAICFFTWFAHRKNIEQMLSGDEHATSFKQMAMKKKIENTELKRENKS